MIAMRTVAALSEATMRCLRIHATPDRESHFDEIDIPMNRRPASPEIAPFEISAWPRSAIPVIRSPPSAATEAVGQGNGFRPAN
jgi:hypothetical protein